MHNDKPDDKLFSGVFYHLSRCLPSEQCAQLSQLLDLNGAIQVKNAKDTRLTHLVTNSWPEALSEHSKAHLVTPLWIERTIVLTTSLNPVHYSPDPAMLFSGVVATSSDLSASDNEVLSAGITSLGGQWRSALIRDVTHVFSLSPGTHKYETAMYYKGSTGMKILVPHWFDDVVRLGVRNLPTDDYEWPEVKLFKAFGVDGMNETESRIVRRDKSLSAEKKVLYETALVDGKDLTTQPPAEAAQVLKDIKIVLGASLDMNDSQRKAHKADIERQGGRVLEFTSQGDELKKIEEADAYITRFRSGPAFVKAYRLNKIIGTLPWLWYVRATGTFTQPSKQLLHYPVPIKPPDGFTNHVITITNYTGKDREYIKKLIAILGAEFTASMSGKNTAVVAAFASGTKTSRAASWGIPVVNHLWLEDCFSQWRDISPAQEKYVVFPPGTDFGTLLTEDRGLGVGRVGYEQEELEAMENELEDEDVVITGSLSQPKKSILKRSEVSAHASMTSVKSREEVEDAVALPATAADVDMDDQAGVGDVSAGAYQDLDVPLNEEGGLSMAGSDFDHEDQMGVDEGDPQSTGRKRTPGTPAKAKSRRLSTPARGRRATPIRKPMTPITTRPSSKSKTQSRPALPSDFEDDEDDETSPLQASKKRSRRASVNSTVGRRSSIKENTLESAADAFSDGGGGLSAKKGSVIKTYRNRSRSESRSRAGAAEDSDEASERAAPTRAKRGKGKAASVGVDAHMEDGSAVPAESPASKVRRSPRRKPTIPSDTEEESVHPKRRLTRSASRASLAGQAHGKDGGAAARTPRRRVSVVVPTLAVARSASLARLNSEAEEHPSEIQEDAKGVKIAKDAGQGKDVDSRKDAVVPRTESTVSQAQAGRAKVPAKRGRPARSKPIEQPPKALSPESESESPPPSSPVRPQTNRPKRAAPVSTSEPRPSGVAIPDLPPSVLPTTSRRSAATKAQQKLHDEIMPDVNNFQKELKSGHVKSALDVQQASAKKVGASEKKGKRRASLGDEDRQSDGEAPDQKRIKTSMTTKKGVRKSGGQRAAGEDEDAGDVEPLKGRKLLESKAASVKKRSSPERPSEVVVMTTQVTLSDDTIKAFGRLGGKFTVKPTECTHLVARSIVRTEKFLCAMAVAPYVVTEKWIETCVSKKTLLPCDEFNLVDTESEKRYGFKLADALERAKVNKGKLFAGKTFYVTPKIPVDPKLLRNVVIAGGGQLLTQTPTVRILKGSADRVVITSSADAGIWRPLAESGYPVYSQELILTGMLKQQLDWDSQSNKVTDSTTR